MRTIEMSAKTVEDAVQAACDALGVDRDDINVSYEVLEFPARKLFKTIPAKVRVTVEEPEPEVTEVAETAAVQETVAAPAPQAAEEPAPAPETPAAPAAPAAEPEAADGETELDIAADPRLQAAVDYLTPIFQLMGVENFTFSAWKKGEATILRVTGARMGALIGRRAAKPWRACPIWPAWWSTVWKAPTSSWAWMWAATATSGKTIWPPWPAALRTGSSAPAAAMRWNP